MYSTYRYAGNTEYSSPFGTVGNHYPLNLQSTYAVKTLKLPRFITHPFLIIRSHKIACRRHSGQRWLLRSIFGSHTTIGWT